MENPARFKSGQEIRVIAGETSSAVLPTEVAQTLPVPVKKDGSVELLIMYFLMTGRHGHRQVMNPPHYAMRLDAETGRVIRFGPSSPAELGIAWPGAPVEGAGVRPDLGVREFCEKRGRFLHLSPAVWAAYAIGDERPEPATSALVAEYWRLFLEITTSDVAPLYIEAARGFFAWVRAVAARASSAPVTPPAPQRPRR